MKILGTGLSGLVGSRVAQLLAPDYTCINISTSSGVDITNEEQVLDTITKSDASYVLHLAAKTDVDGCEQDKQRDQEILSLQNDERQDALWMQEKTAWAINVMGTRNVIRACNASQKTLIFVSTDFVFDGEITEELSYREEDTPRPVNWYAMTKYAGEKLVQDLSARWIIVRLAYPYCANGEKKDFVRAILHRLQAQQPLQMVIDHVMSPTFIDDFAYAIDGLIKRDAQGIYHTVGSECVSPYEAALAIADTFGLDTSLIGQTTRDAFFSGRAPRPFRLRLNNDKIQQLGIRMHSFREGLQEIKRQIRE